MTPPTEESLKEGGKMTSANFGPLTITITCPMMLVQSLFVPVVTPAPETTYEFEYQKEGKE